MKKTKYLVAIVAAVFLGMAGAKAQTYSIPVNGTTFSNGSNYLGSSSGNLQIQAGSTTTNGNILFNTYSGSTQMLPLTIYNTGNVSVGSNSFPSGTNSLTIGSSNSISSGTSLGVGTQNTIGSAATNSFASGLYNSLTGPGSFGLGYQNSVGGWYSGGFGYLNSVPASQSYAFGSQNTSSGGYSFATGTNSTASGSASVAMGNTSTASGTASVALGQYVKATGTNSIVLGLGSSSSSLLTNATNNSLAIGFGGTSPAFTVQGYGSSSNSAFNGNLSVSGTSNIGSTAVGGNGSSALLVTAGAGANMGGDAGTSTKSLIYDYNSTTNYTYTYLANWQDTPNGVIIAGGRNNGPSNTEINTFTVDAAGDGYFGGKLGVTGTSTFTGLATFNGGIAGNINFSGNNQFTTLGVNMADASGYNLSVNGNTLSQSNVLRVGPSWSTAIAYATPTAAAAAPIIELGVGGMYQNICNGAASNYASHFLGNNILWQDQGTNGGNWVFPTNQAASNGNASFAAMGVVPNAGSSYGFDFYTGVAANQTLNVPAGTNGNNLVNHTNNTSNFLRMRINANGQVSIANPLNDAANSGYRTPQSHTDYALSVNGKIVGTSCYITDPNTDWADYVFEKDYKLTPLKEIEAYVKENKHLPEIPTTAEVKEVGINVGQMDVLLLKKVEELTLHMIEMEKKIDNLEKENKELKESVVK